jgi:hypothetical protein
MPRCLAGPRRAPEAGGLAVPFGCSHLATFVPGTAWLELWSVGDDAKVLDPGIEVLGIMNEPCRHRDSVDKCAESLSVMPIGCYRRRLHDRLVINEFSRESLDGRADSSK